MEVIEITTTNKEFRYKAVDGTIFNNESECKSYEESALCVLRSRLKIKTVDAWCFCYGYDENTVEVVEGKKQDVLHYLAFLKLDSCKLSHNTIAEEIQNLIDNYKNDTLLVWRNDEEEVYKVMWKEDFLENIENHCKFEE